MRKQRVGERAAGALKVSLRDQSGETDAEGQPVAPSAADDATALCSERDATGAQIAGMARQTAVGPRRENQDRIITAAANDLMLIGVADGMGGGTGGQQAAALSARAVYEAFDHVGRAAPGNFEAAHAALHGAFPTACDYVQTWARERGISPGGIGTTLTVALASPDGKKIVIAHVGDTRAYLWAEPHGLQQLTKDHAVGNLLSRAISNDPKTFSNPDLLTFSVPEKAGRAVLLISSDGFWHSIPARRIAGGLRVAARGQRSLDAVMKDLMRTAARRAQDNQSVVAVLLGTTPPVSENDKRTRLRERQRKLRYLHLRRSASLLILTALLFSVLGAAVGTVLTLWCTAQVSKPKTKPAVPRDPNVRSNEGHS